MWLCMIKIRILFLEICNSFSEIRRDLWSSYFYCKSNSLEKNVICRKALFFISAPCEVKHTVYRAAGWGEGTLREPRTCMEHVCPILLHCQSRAVWTPRRSFLLSGHSNIVWFFFLHFGCRTPRGQRGKQGGRESACGLVHVEKTDRVGRCFQGAPGSAYVPGLRNWSGPVACKVRQVSLAVWEDTWTRPCDETMCLAGRTSWEGQTCLDTGRFPVSLNTGCFSQAGPVYCWDICL